MIYANNNQAVARQRKERLAVAAAASAAAAEAVGALARVEATAAAATAAAAAARAHAKESVRSAFCAGQADTARQLADKTSDFKWSEERRLQLEDKVEALEHLVRWGLQR